MDEKFRHGGHIVFNEAPPADSRVTITRQVPMTQLSVYEEGGRFSADSHETALDKLTMICQQLSGKVNDSFPTIGDNGNWYAGGKDTHVSATGPKGDNTSLEIEKIVMLENNEEPYSINRGTPEEARIELYLPKGDTGNAATIELQYETLPPGTPPFVENLGDEHHAIAKFNVSTGATGRPGEAATIEVTSTTTLPAGQPAFVENVGDSTTAKLAVGIPKGTAGNDGKSFRWRGVWLPDEDYYADTEGYDVVFLQTNNTDPIEGVSYVCIQTHTSTPQNAPGTSNSNSYWSLFSTGTIIQDTNASGDVKGPNGGVINYQPAVFIGPSGKEIGGAPANLQLTQENFSPALKSKLENISSGAQINVLEGVQLNGSTINPSNKIANVVVNKSTIGLSNVDNTSDANKPVSTATQTALDTKLTGVSSSTDGRIALFSGATGNLLKQSGYSEDDIYHAGKRSALVQLNNSLGGTMMLGTGSNYYIAPSSNVVSILLDAYFGDNGFSGTSFLVVDMSQSLYTMNWSSPFPLRWADNKAPVFQEGYRYIIGAFIIDDYTVRNDSSTFYLVWREYE